MKKLFQNQLSHFVFLLISFWAIAFICDNYPVYLAGELWGVSTKCWLYIAIGSPIIHQIYVLVCWRLELYSQTISKTFGDKGFVLYKVGFAVLILSRPITLTLLAISNTNTLSLNPYVSYLIAMLLSIPSAYLFYSVKKIFGMDRAFGADHFEPEKAKTLPMVNKGVFKYTSNGMYVFGFLILWVPGFLFLSKAALLIALLNHVYICIHYYHTEKPDKDFIYGDNKQ